MFQQKPIKRKVDKPSKYGYDSPKVPKGYSDDTKLDSSNLTIKSSESYNGIEIVPNSEYDLDEYLKFRKSQIQTKIWDSLSGRYDLKKALSGSDLQQMLGQATGMTIPLPPMFTGIFGKPEISLNVNGEVNLRLGWRWDSQNLGAASSFGQTQSSPIFSQDIRLNLTGKIGDKFTIGTDWSTKRQFEFDNRFKLAYEGKEDDVVRLVELGNITFPSSSTLIGSSQALFGVRADFQFGPLFLKTVYSQKRGERKFINARGGATKQYFQLHPYDYAKNHFFLDEGYKSVYKNYFRTSSPILPSSDTAKRLVVKEIEVWESTSEVKEQNATVGVAYADLKPQLKSNLMGYLNSLKKPTIVAGEIESGRFVRLDSNRYEIDKNLGTLSILNMRQDKTYGVTYRVESDNDRTNDDDLIYGSLNSVGTMKEKDTLVLKLISRPNMQPGFKTLWARQMKNIYPLSASNVNANDLKINIYYLRQNNDSSDVIEGSADKIVTILKVDRVNNSTGSEPPDGKFDVRAPYFNARWGEIVFPSLRPFDSAFYDYFNGKGTPQIAYKYMYPSVYDTTTEAARMHTDKDRFVISGEASGQTNSNRITLGVYNLAPGSVRVTLDGAPLKENEDFIVDTYSGIVTLKNPRAMLPNANLNIECEQNDIFNISTKTLFGVRADYQLFKKRNLTTNLGFTLMNYSQSLVMDRVHIGEEPVSNTMLGFDVNTQLNAPWLTKALDALPFYDTKEKSSINFKGEMAWTLPEPNKKLSDVASDNSKPVVYLDDFEGAQRYIPLGLSTFQWTHASQPQDNKIAIDDTSRAKFRAKTLWYQKFLADININDIYPNRQVVQGRAQLTPLHINFNPDLRGIYNNNPKFLDTLNYNFVSPALAQEAKDWKRDNKEKTWGGMMRLLSSFNTNFDVENIDYLEIMMNTDGTSPDAKMYIDLGQISEDIIPNGFLNTEDGFLSAYPMPNNLLDAGEDIGIDQMDDAQEKAVYPFPLNQEADPARDDYHFDFSKSDPGDGEFADYNNYEGNAKSEAGQFPDSEILNRNNGQTLALDNSYFTYEINLNQDANSNPQIVGGNPSLRWFLYRIPIRKPDSRVGNPLFSNIQYVRVWFKGGYVSAKIADWRLAGSQWQRIHTFQNVPANDSVLQLSFVNKEENAGQPDFYSMPPGVQAPRQLNNPDPSQDIRLNEQSIAISVRNLKFGEERMAVKLFRGIDIFNYKELKFFIHGDGAIPDSYIQNSAPTAYAFVRFGTDSSNYYEYRVPMVKGWQDLGVKVADLTILKQLRDSAMQFKRYPSTPNAKYYIEGNPTLTRIQFIGFGISNPAERYPNYLTTTMWVDELRMIDPESAKDWAAMANMNIKMADLATVDISYQKTNPNFHKLEERYGNRVDATNWSMSINGSMEKFLPKAFSETRIPISYSHVELFEKPLYVPQNDINVETLANSVYENEADQTKKAKAADSVRKRSQTLRVDDSWAIQGFKFGIPVKHWLITETVNKVTVGYSYSQTFERNPIVSERFRWIWMLNTKYSTNITQALSFAPLSWADKDFAKFKFNPLPSTLSAGLNLSRGRTTEQSRYLDVPSPVIRDFYSERTAQINWKILENDFINPVIDYSYTTRSTLAPYELNEQGKQRDASELAKMILYKNGRLLDLGKDINHNQTISINFKPRIPELLGIPKYMDMNGNYSSNYTWQDPLQADTTIRDLARNASVNSNFKIGSNLKLKSLADSWWGVEAPTIKQPPLLNPKRTKDSASSAPKVDTTSHGNIFGLMFKTVFLDYENISLNFRQDNNSQNPGVLGGNGFSNFWARGMTFRGSRNMLGPSLPYQLGLVSSPHSYVNVVGSNKFPFFGFESVYGLRPANGVMQDNFNQKSTFDAKTSRPLWEGAILDLSWKSEVGWNKNQRVTTDAYGNPSFSNITALESYQRSFITMPYYSIFKVFNNSVDNVIKIYNTKKTSIENSTKDTLSRNQMLQTALSESFREGLEAFSFSSGALSKILPALNWDFRWEGIEKWDIWKDVARRISIQHTYISNYQENAQITDNGRNITMEQTQFGFQPLIGIKMGFDEKKLKGNLTVDVKYNTQTSFKLSTSARSSIQRQSTNELQINAVYQMRSFDFPLLGISLKNDVEFSFLTSYKSNQSANYDVLNYKSESGQTIDGNTQISIEPRVKYTVSNIVRASAFFRYDGTITEGAANPGYSTTQFGLDIQISISGGR